MESAAQDHQSHVPVGAWHTSRSSPGPGDATASTLDRLERAVGDERATVRLVLPDRVGRLRLAGERGPLAPEGRLRSARRRRVFQTAQACRVELPGSAGRVLHILPLASRGETVGVVEILAPTSVIDERIDLVATAIGQAAPLIRAAREREGSDRVLSGLSASLGLTASMLRTGDPEHSVRAATRLCHEHLALPVVGWLPGEGDRTTIVSVQGFGPARRAEVRRVVATMVPAPQVQLPDALATALTPVIGVRPAVARAGGAFLAVAGRIGREGAVLLDTVTSLLDASLATIGEVTEAKARTDGLDVGIAWTAHELRGPLLGARRAIDHLISVNDHGAQTDLLRHTRDALSQLADLVDPMLRWSAGGELHKRPADLVKIVREAVGSSVLEHGEHRVVVSAPRTLGLRADPKQLRAAVANLLRNALTYSPDGDEVAVEVGRSDGTAWVCVRDRGPGVPPEEGRLIFDLFARGSAGAHAREGTGVGLFITRRVVEAHGGKVVLMPSDRGAAFRIELPIAPERRAASAS